MLKHPSRENQQIMVVRINSYTWAVPFVVEEDGTIFLKTAFPSRKLHKIFGSKL